MKTINKWLSEFHRYTFQASLRDITAQMNETLVHLPLAHLRMRSTLQGAYEFDVLVSGRMQFLYFFICSSVLSLGVVFSSFPLRHAGPEERAALLTNEAKRRECLEDSSLYILHVPFIYLLDIKVLRIVSVEGT